MKMRCIKHPSEGEFEAACPACRKGNPPDIGVQINETTKTTEHFGPGPNQEHREHLEPKTVV